MLKMSKICVLTAVLLGSASTMAMESGNSTKAYSGSPTLRDPSNGEPGGAPIVTVGSFNEFQRSIAEMAENSISFEDAAHAEGFLKRLNSKIAGYSIFNTKHIERFLGKEAAKEFYTDLVFSIAKALKKLDAVPADLQNADLQNKTEAEKQLHQLMSDINANVQKTKAPGSRLRLATWGECYAEVEEVLKTHRGANGGHQIRFNGVVESADVPHYYNSGSKEALYTSAEDENLNRYVAEKEEKTKSTMFKAWRDAARSGVRGEDDDAISIDSLDGVNGVSPSSGSSSRSASPVVSVDEYSMDGFELDDNLTGNMLTPSGAAGAEKKYNVASPFGDNSNDESDEIPEEVDSSYSSVMSTPELSHQDSAVNNENLTAAQEAELQSKLALHATDESNPSVGNLAASDPFVDKNPFAGVDLTDVDHRAAADNWGTTSDVQLFPDDDFGANAAAGGATNDNELLREESASRAQRMMREYLDRVKVQRERKAAAELQQQERAQQEERLRQQEQQRENEERLASEAAIVPHATAATHSQDTGSPHAVFQLKSPATEVTPKQMYEKAAKLHNEEKHSEAFPLFEKAARKGNANAQYAVGYYHEQGLGGLAKNVVEAARWYKMAADQGHGDAKKDLQGLAVAREKAARKVLFNQRRMNELAQSSIGMFGAFSTTQDRYKKIKESLDKVRKYKEKYKDDLEFKSLLKDEGIKQLADKTVDKGASTLSLMGGGYTNDPDSDDEDEYHNDGD